MTTTPHPHLSVPAWERIDQVCMDFEDEWLAGKRPLIESWAQRVPAEERESLVCELLRVEIEHRENLGEIPVATDYATRLGQWIDVVGDVFRNFSPSEESWQYDHQVGRYRYERRLATGAFGTVFLMTDLELQRQVAMKVPRRDRCTDPRDVERWLHEARTLAQLKHPGIIPIYDVGRLPDDIPYLIMPYLSGGTLEQRLDEASMTWQQATEITIQISQAVHYAHSRGFVHRDLKPSNVLLDIEGRAFVGDFGLSMKRRGEMHGMGVRAGTLSYMAPEQFERPQQVGPAADVWALGVVLYEMLTGSHPFPSRDRETLLEMLRTSHPTWPHQAQPEVPRAVSRHCMRCLQKHPDQRPRTADEVARNLQQARERNGLVALRRFAIVALLLGMFLLVSWVWPRRAEVQAGQRIVRALDVLAWSMDEQGMRGAPIDTPGVAPLHAGDQIRIRAQLETPAFIYLLWIDAQGTAVPVYPWTPGDWDSLPEDQQPLREVALPADQLHGWPMEPGPSGMETLLLLARSSPLPSSLDLQQQLGELRSQPLTSRNAVLRMDTSGWIHIRRNRASPGFHRSATLQDDALYNFEAIKLRLAPWFEDAMAVSFAFVGDERETGAETRNETDSDREVHP